MIIAAAVCFLGDAEHNLDITHPGIDRNGSCAGCRAAVLPCRASNSVPLSSRSGAERSAE
jgi:hypothetical protein